MGPKLEVNGGNYQTWLVMLRQAIQGMVGRKIELNDTDLVLVNSKDMLLKTAILASVNDNIKISVAEESSGLAENKANQLFQSGFTLNKESFIGLLFHLSLPNLDSFPFVNFARQIDQHMDRDKGMIKNTELVRLAKTNLTLFCQNRKSSADKQNDCGG
ncbi:hypothetical protein PTTG_06427 [Puccinia triticina 1-1 BBBD Race 1]|uniref:Uncharacterized protein n=1 Tax=Puccinia triticina (isolate 1-1 / race 1 (BBBD)) TaxID=630390 RepID=A0A180GW58_PUCT1|nr:hypothetical protein PTTG_06427 [Puccinia triticina 1-1 BBBD Race 1]